MLVGRSVVWLVFEWVVKLVGVKVADWADQSVDETVVL